MAEGLEVVNDTGTYQITGEYVNLSLITKGTSTLVTDSSYFAQTIVSRTITYTGKNPVVAFSCSGRMNVMVISNSGSNWTFFFTAKALANGTPFDYWIFDDIDQLSITDTVGLEVYDGSGNLVYHSSSKPMRIVGLGAGTYPSGKVYAAAQSHLNMTYNETDLGGGLYRINTSYGGCSINSNVVAIASTIYENYTTTGPTGMSYSTSTGNSVYVILDVTGY
jgi:hypothetical protein